MQELRLEVLTPCNFSCSHCYTQKRPKGKVEIERLFDLMGEARSMGASAVSLTGGEPLIDIRRTVSLVERARALGMSARLNTNGWFVDDNVAERLAKAGLTEAQISLDHDDPTAFDKIRGKVGAFEKVLSAIESFDRAGIGVTVRFTLSSENIAALVPSYRLLTRYPVTTLKVRSIVEVAGIADTERERVETQIEAVVAELVDLANAGPIKLSLALNGSVKIACSDKVDENACKCGQDAVFVSASGDYYPCPFLREDENHNLGNAAEAGLVDLYRTSEALKSFIGRPEAGFSNDAGCKCKAMMVSGAS